MFPGTPPYPRLLLLTALLGGQLDLLLTSDVQARGDLHFEPLFAFDLTLVMAPDHPLCHQGRITPEDLKQHDCLIYTLTQPDWVFKRDGEQLSVRPQGPLRANNGVALTFRPA